MVGFIIFFLGSAFLLFHFYFPRLITEINNPLMKVIRGKSSSQKLSFSKGTPIKFLSKEGYSLSAHLHPSKLDSVKATIILLHGIRSQKESFTPLIDFLNENGYDTVAVDHRAHGDSEGTHCTFGVKEKYDVVSLIDLLEEKGFGKIGVWGQSLGGAVALQTMSIDNRIQFGVVESTFSNFDITTKDYAEYYFKVQLDFFTEYLTKRACKIADFDMNDASPVEICNKIHQPILMVHGKKDQRIPIEYGKRIFENLSSENKEFLAIEGAHHLDVWNIGGEKYFKTVLDFLNQYSN